ncbi:uncharacterized protein ANIA_10859 [Aspergillus nidulans FGSC A4]|uniref:Uncharacterized protein n=1 Tax=Emericella nidulans (strain FGSC A4 / ATCC 38163 / CBS 112.46 / NRRL 194 / M139) TaxID=227321 RepID=C8V2G1_EMENI|nr:hypothetical protein [Aspergillus nidulans FGSC A4]CBF71529.1 TPA: hypothetical protein ANIA_10859 [Aspergillus nidulans FGSC A4]
MQKYLTRPRKLPRQYQRASQGHSYHPDPNHRANTLPHRIPVPPDQAVGSIGRRLASLSLSLGFGRRRLLCRILKITLMIQESDNRHYIHRRHRLLFLAV